MKNHRCVYCRRVHCCHAHEHSRDEAVGNGKSLLELESVNLDLLRAPLKLFRGLAGILVADAMIETTGGTADARLVVVVCNWCIAMLFGLGSALVDFCVRRVGRDRIYLRRASRDKCSRRESVAGSDNYSA